MSDRFDYTLEHMLKTKQDGSDHGTNDAVVPLCCIELITGASRRRQG